MATIDDKIVAMSFESSKFESGVSAAIRSLDKLKTALKFPEAGKALLGIGDAFKRLNLGHVAQGVDQVSNRLSSLRLVAIGVLTDITRRALYAGTQLVKSFTIDPIKAGLQEYATNLNAIQTILANTQAAGTTLEDVNAALKQLNDYSDKTIYNFSQMAKNIGTFTAAGVDLDTAVGSIKGIANLAAVSGSSAEQAATAMYQLSQAISSGRVSLQDWNSVVNAGMGGTVFQRALAQTAVAMGTLDEKTLKLTGKMKNVSIAGESFRNSISARPGEKSWLTSEVLTTTLEQFTGDLTKAELAAQGFNDAQIAAIMKTAKTAQLAATQVKTLEGVLTTAKETAASGWAQTWQIIFGDFAEAKTLFTGISNAINGFIKSSAEARNKVLADWKALGGRTLLIQIIKQAFQDLGEIIKPIKQAFRDIFPAQTGKDLYYLTVQLGLFLERLKPSEQTIDNLRRTFRGLFSIFSIGLKVISGIIGMFRRLFSAAGGGEGGFLTLTARIGDFFTALNKSLEKGQQLEKFFNRLGDILGAPLQVIGLLADALSDLFSGFSSGGVSDGINDVTRALTPFEAIVDNVSKVWDAFVDSFSKSGDVFTAAGESAAKGMGEFTNALGDAAANMNFEAILAVIRTGLVAGIAVMFKKFLGKGSLIEQLGGAGGGILGNISQTFDALRGSMVALQNNIRAKTLKEIAIAIALLTASVVALSFVNPDKLKASLTAMAVAFAQLLAAMAILEKITTHTGFLKMPFIAASMIALAAAIDLLSVAVVALSFLSWEDLLKGLGGVAALLAAIAASVGPLSASSAGLIRAGVGITAIAIALNLLAIAVRQLGSMDMASLGKGLGSIAVSLGIMVKATALIKPAGLIRMGVGLAAIAISLNLLALAVKQFSGMSMRELAKGLGAVAITLGVLTAALFAMSMIKGLKVTSIQLIAVAGALKIIASAISQLGGMSLEDIGKGLGALGVALVGLAVGLKVMSGSIAGAAALAITAGALGILVPQIMLLGQTSWKTLVKGMVGLGIALGILAVAAQLITPAVPGVLAFSVALLALGAAIALIGAGLFLISAAFSALVVALPTGVGVMVAAMQEFARGMIENAKLLILGILEIVEAFAATAPKFADALVKIIASFLDAVIESAPKIAEAFSALLRAGLQVLTDNQDQIIAAGLGLILSLLQGIRDNIPQLVAVVTDIIVNFLVALGNNYTRIVQAGADLMLKFISGIINNIGRVTLAVMQIILKFVSTVASNLGKIATAGLSVLTKFLDSIAKNLGKVIKAGTDIVVKFIEGIGNAGSRIITAAVNTVIKFIEGIGKNAGKLADAGLKMVIDVMNGISDAIDANSEELGAAGVRMAGAMIRGMANAIRGGVGEIKDALLSLIPGPLKSFAGKLGLNSPSKVFYEFGGYIVEGLANGISANGDQVTKSMVAMSEAVIKATEDTFQTHSPSKVMYEIGKFVGQGFAQGLRGSASDIRDSFAELNEKLTEAMRTARETIASEEEKLAKLRKEKKPDEEAIKKAQAVIAQNQELLKKSTAAHTALVRTLKNEKTELIGLSNEYERISNKLAAAEDTLKTLIDARKAALEGYEDQYNELPDIITEKDGEILTAAQQVTEFITGLGEQVAAVGEYGKVLAELQTLGLSKDVYEMLLAEGPSALEFAKALAAGGPELIKSINTMDKQLKSQSKILGTNAAGYLHDVGIKAAQGVVKGLRDEKSKIYKEMEEIARGMIRALKKELGIKSPSKAFAEIARFAMEGMAKGFKDSSGIIVDSMDQAAKDALFAMRKSMRNISELVADELNPNPVITPILNLGTVQQQAAQMRTLFGNATTGAMSFAHASNISSMQGEMEADDIATASRMSVKFEQNNYSPDALSEIEIYRQTKNQLSQFKSALAVT